jgi:hypothetical protein
MIGTGRKLTAFSPKKTKTGKTMFSVQDFDKNNPNAKRYATVFCNNEVEVNDRDKIKIDFIQGIGLGEYNGKLQVSIFAQVSLDVESSLNEMAGNVPTDITDQDLPF